MLDRFEEKFFFTIINIENKGHHLAEIFEDKSNNDTMVVGYSFGDQTQCGMLLFNMEEVDPSPILNWKEVSSPRIQPLIGEECLDPIVQEKYSICPHCIQKTKEFFEQNKKTAAYSLQSN